MQKRFMTQKALFIGKNFLEKSVFSLEKPQKTLEKEDLQKTSFLDKMCRTFLIHKEKGRYSYRRRANKRKVKR